MLYFDWLSVEKLRQVGGPPPPRREPPPPSFTSFLCSPIAAKRCSEMGQRKRQSLAAHIVRITELKIKLERTSSLAKPAGNVSLVLPSLVRNCMRSRNVNKELSQQKVVEILHGRWCCKSQIQRNIVGISDYKIIMK